MSPDFRDDTRIAASVLLMLAAAIPVTLLPHIRANRVRALGVSTRTRLAVLQEVPTIAETGVPGYEVVGWNGILVPTRTPQSIIQRLPEVVQQLAAQGIEPIGNTPEQFAAIVRSDIAKWANVVKQAGIRAN